MTDRNRTNRKYVGLGEGMGSIRKFKSWENENAVENGELDVPLVQHRTRDGVGVQNIAEGFQVKGKLPPKKYKLKFLEKKFKHNDDKLTSLLSFKIGDVVVVEDPLSKINGKKAVFITVSKSGFFSVRHDDQIYSVKKIVPIKEAKSRRH